MCFNYLFLVWFFFFWVFWGGFFMFVCLGFLMSEVWYSMLLFNHERKKPPPKHKARFGWKGESLFIFRFPVIQVSWHGLCLRSWTAKQGIIPHPPRHTFVRLWNVQVPFPSVTGARVEVISVPVLGACVDFPITAEKVAHTILIKLCANPGGVGWLGWCFLFEQLSHPPGTSWWADCCSSSTSLCWRLKLPRDIKKYSFLKSAK